MKQVTIHDLEALSVGSAILGSGGGGDPTYAYYMAKHRLEQYGPVRLISIDDLKMDDLIVPLAIMGAPMVNMERLISGKELEALISSLELRLEMKTTVLMPGEIGGANAFAPLLVAAKLNLPVLDADLIGRAFPELQMNSCHLKNYPATPAVLADALGNSVIVDTVDVFTLERIARQITIGMGSSAAIALHLMQGNKVKGAVVENTLSRAINLGHIVLEARKKSLNAVEALLNTSEVTFLAQGTLADISQEIRNGFLYGSVSLMNEKGKMQIHYQNEYLLATDVDGSLLGVTPDILMLLEEGSGTPITSEALKFGLQVVLISIPAPPIWKTPEGLALVGPKAFNYQVATEIYSKI